MSRDLLNRAREFIGLDQRIWALLETGGYGKDATGGLSPAAADAIEHVAAGIEFNIPREIAAHRSGRSAVVRLSGKKEVKFNFQSYIVPAEPTGTNPNLPDMHPFLLSAFGAVDETDPTKKIYSLARSGNFSFRMLEEGTHFSRQAVGCVTDTLTFTLPGDGKAMVKAEGFAQDVAMAGETLLDQALTGSAQAASAIIQDLTYTAVTAGQSGNSVSIAYTTGATAGAEVVTVLANAISVQIETGVSSATQVKAAVDGSIPAAALVSVAISGVGSDPQTAPVAATFLTGGLGANDFKVTAGQMGRLEIGAYIDIVSATDGDTLLNTNRLISALGSGVNADIVSVSGAALAASPSGSIVIGYAPDFTASSSENALLGLKGSFTSAEMGSIDCDILSAEIALKNNYTPRANAYGTSEICGFLSDKRREVTIKLEVLLTKENFEFYSNNKKFIADDLTITLAPQDIPAPAFSDATGRTFTWHLPRVEFNIPKVEQPADGFIKLALEGVAMASDINTVNDEMTLEIS